MTVAVPGTIVIARAEPTDERGPVLFVQGTTPTIADGTAKPRTLTLLSTERPFLLELDDLCLAVDADGNLSPAKTTNPQYRVVFQELMVEPFSPSTCPESCNHKYETNLSFDADLSP
jgi:hypothetical protein